MAGLEWVKPRAKIQNKTRSNPSLFCSHSVFVRFRPMSSLPTSETPALRPGSRRTFQSSGDGRKGCENAWRGWNGGEKTNSWCRGIDTQRVV